MQKNSKQYFPKVHKISTVPLSPDIDLLSLDQEKQLVDGYEFKVMKYTQHWKG